MMFAHTKTRKIMRILAVIMAASLLVSFSAVGQSGQPDDQDKLLYGVHAPFVIRDATYQESIGVLDLGFSADGWLLTNFAGSMDNGYAVVIQPTDGKVLVAGSFDGTTLNFGLARFNPDGSLDDTFDGDGRVVTDFSGTDEDAYAMALQPDGKIILAGTTSNIGTRNDFAVVRYNPNGSLDTSFGGDGLVTTDVLGNVDYASGVVLQADNKIVVAGYSWNGTNYDFTLVRYNPDGGLDGGFSDDGKVSTDFGKSDYAYAIIRTGDKLVVAGKSGTGSGEDFALARYNANGSLDTSFDTDGKVVTDFLSGLDRGRALIQQADGKLVVTGWAVDGTNYNIALARYNDNGSLDTSFDSDGKVMTDFVGGADYGYGIVQDPDTKYLVVAGYTLFQGDNNFALARYTLNGALDPSFDSDGMVTTDFNGLSDYGYALARQTDGRLVVAGNVTTIAGTDLALARYDTSGGLDAGFDGDGRVITNLFGSSDQGQAILVQPDGKLVLVGSVGGGGGTDFGVARYYSNGNPDSSFDIEGHLSTDINGFDDYAFAATVQPDGKLVVAGAANDGAYDNFVLVRYNPDGDLDITFDGDGIVVMDYAGYIDQIYAILVQSDGKLVVAGQVETATSLDFALARYHPDGSLDTTFGSNGWTVTDFFGKNDCARALVQQLDGKLVVAGYANDGVDYSFAVARYSVDGSPDPTFDGDGRVVTEFGGGDDLAYALTLQTDSKIVVVGWTFNGVNNDFALARYNPNGSLDSTFDGDGRVITDITGNADYLTAVGMQPNGKIMVGGLAYTANGYDFALARYHVNGSLDTAFSTDGWLVTDFYGGDDSGRAIIMQPGGQVIMAGYASNGSDFDFAIARYR
jgi:uncharacterized delta-60 repeat protein